MVKENAKLIHGLDYNGQTYYNYTLTPITLAQELAALDEIEAVVADAISERHAEVLQNLAYVAKMIEIKGIDAGAVNINYLFNYLSSADYNGILDAIKALNAKFSAAGHQHTAEVAATKEIAIS